VTVRSAIRSDIWFPWVLGFLSESTSDQEWFDNRPLATRHTRRLNAFLTAARQATLDAGGDWELNPEIKPWRPPRPADLDAAGHRAASG